jgi:predicted ester cyclase
MAAMADSEVRELLQRFAVDPWSTGILEGLDDVVAPDCVLAPNGTIDDLKQAIGASRAALPDLTVTVDETIAQEDKIAYRWTMRGTHQGDYQGLAATGKPVTFTGITMLRVRDGKVIEDRFESSSPDLPEQVSATPAEN